MSNFAGVNLTRVDTDPMFTLGLVYQAASGKKYKYVQYDTGAGGIAAVAGNVCYYYAPGGVSAGSTTKVTSDLSDSANVGAGVIGRPSIGES